MVAARLGSRLTRSIRICDPACGAGDLLLAAARRLPVAATVTETLEQWGRHLCGADISRSFISATRIRLALLAVSRLGYKPAGTSLRLSALLPRFAAIDVLNEPMNLNGVTHIVLNPPFTAATTNASGWAVGSVTSASLFLERCIKSTLPGTRVLAILPEVLRGGARYERWRQSILSRARINEVKILGRFDRWTDIDVFLVDLTVRPAALVRTRPWPLPVEPPRLKRLGSVFEIHVGPVVPYRDRRRGALRPYIDTRSAPRWGAMRQIREQRRYMGRTFDAPFVLVRRTSRPGDQHRAVATLVSVGVDIAVENHLMVLLPKDGKVVACRRLLTVLRNPRTTRWLDHRIGCRHLTVGSLSHLPMWRAVT